MKNQLTIKHHKQETKLFNRRVLLCFCLIILFIIGLSARLFYLQVLQHSFYSTLSEQNLMTIIPTEPNRGLIYDRNGIILAKNIPAFNLTITPGRVKNIDEVINRLRLFIEITPHDIHMFQRRRRQLPPHQPIPLKLKLTEAEVARFSVNQYFFPGVSIQARMIRTYPLGELMSHVLGYVGRINTKELNQIDQVNYSASDYIGKLGIEKYYEDTLHGVVGNEEVETDASGRIVRVLKRHRPVPGKDIFLTIDSRLQQAASDILGEESGAIVVLNPRNGEVLAMVSKPTYNPEPFVLGISAPAYKELLNLPQHPLYDRVIRGVFAPGSTMKPFFAIAGLKQKVISPQTSIKDDGIFSLPNSSHLYHDWNWKWKLNKGGHGIVNISKAITVSCDVFFYNLATKLGVRQQQSILQSFGLGKRTDIDVPNELSGLVPSPAWKRKVKGESWYPGDTVITGIGQGFLLATPLQLAQAIGILAMRGIRYQPHLLQKTLQANGAPLVTYYLPEKRVALEDPKIWPLVIAAMQGVITNPRGTAHRFGRDAPYTAAGKTGTAQLFGRPADEEREQSELPKELRNNHLFIAFAPVENPEIAIAVVYEHNTGADGLARKVMDYYFNSKNRSNTN